MRLDFKSSSQLVIGACFVAGMIIAPSPAGADGFITPFVGVNFGGATDSSLSSSVGDNSKLTYGVSMGWMGKGVIGLEEDFAYTPKFFAPAASVGQTNALTIMSNVIVGIPIGGQHGAGIRPYFTGGVGLLRTNVEQAMDLVPDQNSFGFDLGGGIDGYFSDHVGIRGDARYLHAFSVTAADSAIGVIVGESRLNFWRGSLGVVFRF